MILTKNDDVKGEWKEWNGFGICAGLHVNRIEDYLSKVRSIIMTAWMCARLKEVKDGASD